MKYQLVILGPSAGRYDDLHKDALEARIRDLKLDPDRDFEFLGEADLARVNWKGIPAGLWYGGRDTSSSDALEALQSRAAPVLPLVEDLADFPNLVPETLRPINGRAWDNPQVPGDVLQAFRLTRDIRQAFLSYRRVDATPVANGLHEALTGRGYRVFLDTASVEAGARFQDVLWDRLADMELMILLDSPRALTSRWVNDELTRVNQLGLGVLQLVWPEPHRRSKGTELSEPFDLEPAHFEGGDSGPAGRLTQDALKLIVARAEEVRIRSLSARRARVLHELIDRAERVRLRPNLYPMGPITFRTSDPGSSTQEPIVGVAVPIVGLPDAWSIHQVQKQLQRLMDVETDEDLKRIEQLVERGGVRIVYDGLGVQTDRTEHLGWLNERLTFKTAHFDRAQGEPSDPLELWLNTLGAGPAGGMR